jgi:hypothetical protein
MSQQDDPCHPILVSIFCGCCAVIQEKKQIASNTVPGVGPQVMTTISSVFALMSQVHSCRPAEPQLLVRSADAPVLVIHGC